MSFPKNNPTIYCISGLGADERIFSNLRLPGFSLTPLPWLIPVDQEETIASYALRMAAPIQEKEPILLGVSFGGMMAIEIARSFPKAIVIIVSSIKSREELPRWMRWAGQLRLDWLIPRKPWRLPRVENSFLGATTPEEVELVASFRRQTDPRYIRWAIVQILNWKNSWRPETLYHIHGTDDRTFPMKSIRPTHIVKGGGHFMIYSMAGTLSEIITSLLKRSSGEN